MSLSFKFFSKKIRFKITYSFSKGSPTPAWFCTAFLPAEFWVGEWRKCLCSKTIKIFLRVVTNSRNTIVINSIFSLVYVHALFTRSRWHFPFNQNFRKISLRIQSFLLAPRRKVPSSEEQGETAVFAGYWKIGNSGKWYRNFPEKFPDILETVEFPKWEPFSRRF